MIVNINWVEDNINYIENKDSVVFAKTEDGFLTVFNNLPALSYRIWLDRELPLEIGLNYLYEITSDNGKAIEGNIIEKGTDENGTYIIFFSTSPKPHPIPLLGENKIEAILSPNMIKGADELIKLCGGSWPNFHEAYMKIIEKKDGELILEFNDGFLDDKIVRFELNDIISEEYDESIESFLNEQLSGVDFKKKGDYFEFKVYIDYKTSKLPDDFDISNYDNFEDLDLTQIEGYVVEEIKNYGVIRCKEIEVSTRVDEIKKLEIEKAYLEFKEACKKQSF